MCHGAHLRCHRWAVVLAGGDGQRLLSLTRRIAGDDRPKQFCTLIGDYTLLHQTLLRTGRLAPLRRTLLVLTKTHEPFYSQQLNGIPPSRLIIQPDNRGTAPAILYTLMRLRDLDPRAVLAFFPSDHHFSDDAAFLGHMKIAFEAAESHPWSVVLLGATPETPESGYGWIEPGAVVADWASGFLRRVTCFWEKPYPRTASTLMDRGCLWNTFVMAGCINAFLNLIVQALPSLSERFQVIRSDFITAAGSLAISKLYSGISSASFCREVLARRPQDLLVLCGTGMGWSDLGDPSRVCSILKHVGAKTDWRLDPAAEQWPESVGLATG